MPSLFMVMLGCRPPGRLTEQHDIFFGIADSLDSLMKDMKTSWPEAKGRVHIDAWRKVQHLGGFEVKVFPRTKKRAGRQKSRLFFINLGGYKPGEFDEFHYRMIIVAESKAAAFREAKQSAFFRHTGFRGAASHIDDKYGIDIDDAYDIEEILPEKYRKAYEIRISRSASVEEDEIHPGYLKLKKEDSQSL